MAAKKKQKKPSALKMAKARLAARAVALRDVTRDVGYYKRLYEDVQTRLNESEASRDAWVKKAVDLEQRAELAEDALRALLESGLKARPSVPLVIAQAPQINGLPHPTFGEPGDGPTGRYSREART